MNLNKLFLRWIAVVLLFTVSLQAAISITSSTLNSSTSVTVAPSATISANVAVTLTSGTRWRSTSWQIGSATPQCVNHTNHDNNGNYNETFNITAPSSDGTYNVIFIASSDNSCGSTTTTATMNNAVTVVTPQVPPLMGDVPNQIAYVGTAFSLNIGSYVTLTNSDPIISHGYHLTGTLPAGLSFDDTTGVISGTPTAVTSAVTMSITASDNDGASNSDSFTITVVAPINAVNDSYTVVNNTTVSGNVENNDTGTGITVTSWSNPSHGTLSGKTSAGAFIYTPTSGYTGSDSFTYIITDSTNHTATATVTITVVAPSANLVLTNTDNPDPVVTGTTLTYTLGVTNNGPQSATSLTLTDTLPTGVIYQSASGAGWSCSQASGVVTCTNPSLANGGSAPVTITVTAPLTVGTITNTATVTSAVTDPTPSNNTNITQTTTVVALSTDLVLTNTDSADPVSPNAPFTYTLSVTNSGAYTATDLNLTDTLPSGVTYQSASGSGWSCAQVSGIVTCTNPSLVSGGSSNVILSVTAPATVPSPNPMINTASLTSTTADPVSANNTNITQSTTVSMPTISINDVSIFEGSNGSTRTMTFTVTVSPSSSGTIDYNTSNVTATAGLDYGATSGSITFVAGELTSRDINIPIYGDSITEGTETFRVTLSNASGFTISKAVGVGTIYDYGSTIFRNGERDFELRNPQNTRNKTGDVLVVGNTVQCVTDTNNGFNGTCTTNLSRTANDYYTKYLNSDTNTSTFNSSSATLAGIPSGAKVIWAGLYWEGFMHQCTSSTTDCRYRYSNGVAPSPVESISSDNIDLSATSYDTQKVYIEIPNKSVNGYQQVTASVLDYRYSSGASGTIYSAFLEITDLINPTNANGVYTVANIQSMEGKRGWGNFGAWSLFVIYEDLSKTAVLRNMSIYDGFKTVSNSSSTWATIPLSGFMTPTQGTVDSKLLSFAGEGEYAYSPDHISVGGDTNYVSNTENPSDNVFNSTIAGFVHNPSYANANGIDIDIFDVSGFMHNAQTSTTVKITSGYDAFYPSVIGFSTQLYAPDVCYYEDIAYNGQPVSATNTPENGKDIDVTVTVTNKDNEPAQGVFIEKVFDKPAQQLTYKSGSMSIRQIGDTVFNSKTDTLYDDTAEYDTVTNTGKYLLGIGATGSGGGTIAKNQETQFKYTTTIGTDENISENVYLVSYRNDYLKISFQGIPIRKCVDFNNTFGAYSPVIGKFNTVRHNAVNVNAGETDPVDQNDAKNALYTQIVDLPFNVDVISFATDNITPSAPNPAVDLNLSIVTVDADGNCTDANISAVYPIHFSTSDKYKPDINVTATKASQTAAFKMKTSTATLCSRDEFAIRPASYNMDANDTQLIGGRVYNFTFTAGKYGAVTTASPAYNQSIQSGSDKNATTQLVLPSGCSLPAPVEFIPNALPFSDGQVSAAVSYSNVGDVNFTVSDNQWSYPSHDQAKGDCILGSATNTPDANGKIGCMVQSSKVFNFVPKQLNNTMAITSNNGIFTYVSSNADENATMNLTITAILDNGNTATNYTANCFARDVDYTVQLNNNQLLGWNDTQNRVHFYPDGNTTQVLGGTSPLINLLTPQTSFTSGIARPILYFNFDRNITIADNPFNIARNDFNITTMLDQNNTQGADFIRTGDMNVTFVYGRVNPLSTTAYGTTQPINAQSYMEVYGVSPVILGGTSLPLSKTTRDWWINSAHTLSDGNATVTVTNPANHTPATTTYVNGVTSYRNFANIPTPPFDFEAHIQTASWLWYGENALAYHDPANPGYLDCLTHPCFNVKIRPTMTNWVGGGTDKGNKSQQENTTDQKMGEDMLVPRIRQ